jgi:L-2-hydroxyglutarate oxidase
LNYKLLVNLFKVHLAKDNSYYDYYDIAIIGAGILGTSLAFFLSAASSARVVLLEQEHGIAFHSSSRNTGKVHAPFLYDPCKKKLLAKAAFLGFGMLKEYCTQRSLPFLQDGVLEVATRQKEIDRLYKYMEWGYSSGLGQNELKLLEQNEVKKIEPNVRCLSAIYCSRDASVCYGEITRHLLKDTLKMGCILMCGQRVSKIVPKEGSGIILDISHIHFRKGSPDYDAVQSADRESSVGKQFSYNRDDYNKNQNSGNDYYDSNVRGKKDGNTRKVTEDIKKISAGYLISTAGGNALNIAHNMGYAKEYSDLHFRGEYWQAPQEYKDLTRRSIYSVPKFFDYPFLDPHWILRVDGRCEVGPNAVPVFGPYAYDWNKNLRSVIPKVFESSKMPPGLFKIFTDREFLSLASMEIKSALSKKAMINRAKEFLPTLDPSRFIIRGTSGIRSLLIDKHGRFYPDTLIIKGDKSLHVLNYNSPGATGALPIAAMIVNQLMEDGIVQKRKNIQEIEKFNPWQVDKIALDMTVQ